MQSVIIESRPDGLQSPMFFHCLSWGAFQTSRNMNFGLWYIKETGLSRKQFSPLLLFKSPWDWVLGIWMFPKGFQPDSWFCLFYLSQVRDSWIFAFLNRTFFTFHLVLNGFQRNSKIGLGHPATSGQSFEIDQFPPDFHSILKWWELVHL